MNSTHPASPAEAEALRRRLFNVVGAATWQMEQLLGLLEIVVDTSVPTAAVECRVTPRLFINPDFVRDHCRTDEALFMLVLHELHHVVLGHTRLFDRPTPAHNIAFDAVINAMLCAQFPQHRHVAFFQEINGADGFPGRLLRPPVGWPERLVFAPDASEAERRILSLLYGPATRSITYLELFNLLVAECLAFEAGDAVLLGNHEGGRHSGATTDPLLQGVLARIVGAWPRPPLNLGGRDEGGDENAWRLAPPSPPHARLRTAMHSLLRRAGVLAGRGAGPWRTQAILRPRTEETVVIQPRDRRVPAWRALHGTWPILYRTESAFPPAKQAGQPAGHGTLAASHGTLAAGYGAFAESLPDTLRSKLEAMGKRPGERIRPMILELCAWRALTATELANLFGRSDSKALKRDHLGPMIAGKELEYTHPDMERHPKQAYRTINPKASP